MIYIRLDSLPRLKSRLSRFILLQPALANCATQKTRHTLCSHNFTILCRPSLALFYLSRCPSGFSLFTRSAPSALTLPRHTVPRMFSFRRFCHIVTAPHFLRVCPDLAFRFRVFTPHHPILSCYSRMIFFLYTALHPIHSRWMHKRAVVIICGLSATPLPRPPPMPSCLSLPTTPCRVLASFPIGPVRQSADGGSGDPSSGLYQYHTI